MLLRNYPIQATICLYEDSSSDEESEDEEEGGGGGGQQKQNYELNFQD